MKEKYWQKLEKVRPEVRSKYRSVKDYLEMEPETKEYFDGFGEEITDLDIIASGMDSSVFLVKLKKSKNRTQLVKVYHLLNSQFESEKDLISILNEYFLALKEAREFLKNDNNPLEQEIALNNKVFKLQYSVAPSGILVERNGEVGSWVRDWMEPENVSMTSDIKAEITEMVYAMKNWLSQKLKRNVDAGPVNYKIYVDDKDKKVSVVFTDLTDYIPRFINSKTIFDKVYGNKE